MANATYQWRRERFRIKVKKYVKNGVKKKKI